MTIALIITGLIIIIIAIYDDYRDREMRGEFIDRTVEERGSTPDING